MRLEAAIPFLLVISAVSPSWALESAPRLAVPQPHLSACRSTLELPLLDASPGRPAGLWTLFTPFTGKFDLQVRVNNAWEDCAPPAGSEQAVYVVKDGKPEALRYRAYTKAGVTAFSGPVPITWGRRQIEITWPEPGRHFRVGDIVPLMANSADDACDIRRVTWLLDGAEIASSTTPPFVGHLKMTAALGKHRLTAAATLVDGRTQVSPPIAFRVTQGRRYRPDQSYRVTPSDKPAPKPAKPLPRHKPAPRTGKGQTLIVRDSADDPGSPGYGYLDGRVRAITTSDGLPPKNLPLRLSLEGYTESDEQMSRIRIFHYAGERLGWVPTPGSAVDSNTLTVSAPIREKGMYCLSLLPPRNDVTSWLWWLTPARNAVVEKPIPLMTAFRGAGEATTTYSVMRLGPDRNSIPASYSSDGPITIGPAKDSLHLDERSIGREATFDGSHLVSGRYEITAHAADDADDGPYASRTIELKTDVKPPTVRFTQDVAAVSVAGLVKGVSGEAHVGSFELSSLAITLDGYDIGQADIDEASLTLDGQFRWTVNPARLQMPPTVQGYTPKYLTVVATDRYGNTSDEARIPVRMTLLDPVVGALAPEKP